MEEQVIEKKDIKSWIEGLFADYEVYAPVLDEKKGKVYKKVESTEDINLEFLNSKNSPKDIYFPQTERLFSFSRKDEMGLIPPHMDDKKKIVFGIRPCDAMAFTMLDKVFVSGENNDFYFIKRSENTLTIGIGCIKPDSTCFCKVVGGEPSSEEGLDILLIDTGKEYVAEPVTDKGKSLIEGSSFFKEATPENIRLKEEAITNANEKIQEFDISGLKERLDRGFDLPVWAKIHEKCVGCGICTFLCPTCHCFDILDEEGKEYGERIRIWDSCQFPLFTKHASGANPRPTGKERMRQRIMHKFKYFVENNDIFACVGCGRCVKYCPVNLDIREVLKSLAGDGGGKS
ncbi:MAG: 4Fe-4S dicluster domain-containing protein [Thermodesulfobacteriota bacterium]|nr:4Fe-4S dicluster domain-containing protein [Thermodesulfobacteriota bacterium]